MGWSEEWAGFHSDTFACPWSAYWNYTTRPYSAHQRTSLQWQNMDLRLKSVHLSNKILSDITLIISHFNIIINYNNGSNKLHRMQSFYRKSWNQHVLLLNWEIKLLCWYIIKLLRTKLLRIFQNFGWQNFLTFCSKDSFLSVFCTLFN